jgi:transposase-like protein
MSKKTKKRSRRRFTDEFKAETVKLVKQSDRTMSAIAMLLSSIPRIHTALDHDGALARCPRTLTTLAKPARPTEISARISRPSVSGMTGYLLAAQRVALQRPAATCTRP